MTERQIAEASGYSRGVVHRKLSQGRSPAEIVDGGKEREERKNLAAIPSKDATGSDKSKRGSKKPGDEGPDLNHPREDETYWDAQRRKETATANLKEMEVEQKRGELVPSTEVEIRWATICTTIRDGMLSLPTKLSDKLAAMTNEKEIAAFLRTEIRAELTRVSGSVAKLAEAD